jgi:hypothetical protein
MVVGQYAAVDAGRGEAGHVSGVHAVMDAFAGPGILAGGDRSLQVDDAQVRPGTAQRIEGIAPDVGKVDRPADRAVCLLGQLHIAERRAHPGFEQARLSGVRQDLVDAAPGHEVAGQEQGDAARACLRWHDDAPSWIRRPWIGRSGSVTRDIGE